MFNYFVVLLLLCGALHAEVNVLAFAGSTRDDSCNKKLAAQVASFAEQLGAKVTLIDLKDYPMPFYDGDLERDYGMPENAKRFQKLLRDNQVIFIASPEYNHSVSAVLKNTLDWASRSEQGQRGKGAFDGKKFVLLSASPGKKGGAKGLAHLRDIITDVKGIVAPQEFSLSDAYNAFNDQGKLVNPDIELALKQFVQRALEN